MEFTAKTIEEAINLATEHFSCKAEDISFDIIQEPTKKLFGLMSKPAKIEVEVKSEFYAKKYLADIFNAQNLKITIEVEGNVINLCGEDAGKVIGNHGQTLNALQMLFNVVVNKYAVDKVHFELDALGYRAKRREALEKLARSTAKKVLRTKKSVAFEPMPRSERKIIHEVLAEFPGVKSESVGNEPYRKVVVRG